MIQGVWAQQERIQSAEGSVQDKRIPKQSNKAAFTVTVTYMTRGGEKMTDSVLVFASDSRAAEREAEALFKERNNRQTFISASARVDRSQPSDTRDRDRSREDDRNDDRRERIDDIRPGHLRQFSVVVTYRTRGGTEMTDIVVIQASSPRAAEREAETKFKAANSRQTFISAQTK
ncbi:MAG: hypothetical protein LBU99_04880 [Spirochaetaceae bacterium]|nr:hypothetical protein [Spirochaetaceae bacterium]